jgi:hypothetical protein
LYPARSIDEGELMGSIVQLGDVPAWIGAATGAASIYVGLRNRQQAQALDFAQTLEQLTDLTPLELRQVVEDHPVIAQMVHLAWEEAARTASEDKRRLLAKVVAAAISGNTDTAAIDELSFLLRTVMALDPAHVSLLVVATSKTAGGRPHIDSIRADRWSGSRALFEAALATLEREGLIYPDSTSSPRSVWNVGGYGQLFLDFLVRSGETEPPQVIK